MRTKVNLSEVLLKWMVLSGTLKCLNSSIIWVMVSSWGRYNFGNKSLTYITYLVVQSIFLNTDLLNSRTYCYKTVLFFYVS
jgi:hypothetical protein